MCLGTVDRRPLLNVKSLKDQVYERLRERFWPSWGW